MSDKFLVVTKRLDPDGVMAYLDKDGVEVAYRMPWCGTVADVRKVQDKRGCNPFAAMSPCPYCDVENDRKHDPMKHIDYFLGEKIT